MTKKGTRNLIIAVGVFATLLGILSGLATIIQHRMLVELIVGVALILVGIYCFRQVKKGNYQALVIRIDKPDDSDW